jgi:putative glutamine amidotransferase
MSAVVAVTAPRRTDGGQERVALNSAYVRALAAVGLMPLVVPPIVEPALAVRALDSAAGLVLTGGEDVEPKRYKAAPHPKLGAVDPARDAVELALLEAAWQRRLPLLAICRGIQLLNVFLGGTLFQDLPSERPAGVRHEGNGARHGLTVERGSTMCATLGATTLDVNSRHHQAVRDLADDLLATAWAEDGLIEGAEAKDGRRVLAVQWHPEDEHGDALFRGFARAVA